MGFAPLGWDSNAVWNRKQRAQSEWEVRAHLVRVPLAACVQSGVEFVLPIAEQAGVQISISAADGPVVGPWQRGCDPPDDLEYRVQCDSPHAGGRKDSDFNQGVGIRECLSCGCSSGRQRLRDSEDMVEHIFEAGFSATGETPGLGLAVCKRLMMQHGGEIKAMSRVNEGTVIQLEFPIL